MLFYAIMFLTNLIGVNNVVVVEFSVRFKLTVREITWVVVNELLVMLIIFGALCFMWANIRGLVC